MENVRVLLVDDDPIVLKMVGNMLTEVGCQIQKADSAEQALEIFDKDHFEIVLTDVHMTGIDGIDMLNKMRSVDGVVVPIVMTSDKDQDVAVRAMKFGVNCFLAKPFASAELSEKIEDALQERNHVLLNQKQLDHLTKSQVDLQQKVSEQGRRLSRMERFQQQLLDATPFGIVSTSKKGTILTFNHTAEKMYGYVQNEVVGRSASYVFGDGFEMSLGKKAYHVQKNGHRIPVLIHRHDVKDDAHQDSAYLYVIEDRSEREMMEAQLLYADRLSLLGQIAPRIAHELKTPLQLIQGYAEMASVWMEKGRMEQVKDSVNRIIPATHEIVGIVNQMFDLGKPREMVREVLDLTEEFNRVLEMLRPLGIVKYCKVVKNFPADVPPVYGNREQINHVFRNLIVNATHAMEKVYSKVLTLGISFNADQDVVEVVVEDTGTGIDEKSLSHIFQPFFTTKGKDRGTGLGLSIVKTIMERHDAEIDVESVVGQGTRFVMRFPSVKKEQCDDLREGASTQTMAPQKMRVS